MRLYDLHSVRWSEATHRLQQKNKYSGAIDNTEQGVLVIQNQK